MYHDLVRSAGNTEHTGVTPETADAAVVCAADTAHHAHCVVDDLEAFSCAVIFGSVGQNAVLNTVIDIPCALVE